MSFKKFIALMLAVSMLAFFSAGAFAASGEGYFGSGEPDEDVIADDGYDDYDDGYDDYEPLPEDAPGQQNPVLPPMEEEGTTVQPSAPSSQMRTAQSLNDKREKNSENTEKVIRSYGLSASATKSLIARHKDADKGNGNREKASRYSRILQSNPNDYLAAYRLAQVNFAMGRNGQALSAVNRCLQIFPNYQPARRLRTRLQAPKK